MRPGMTCTECGIDDACMHAICANDDALPDPWSARRLLGCRLWESYCERWNPLRWSPRRLLCKRRKGGAA